MLKSFKFSVQMTKKQSDLRIYFYDLLYLQTSLFKQWKRRWNGKKTGALSIQQKSPVQTFGIFAGRMERVGPPPRIRGHVLRNTGPAGWNFVVLENGGLFEHFRNFKAGWLLNNKLYHFR